MAWFDLDEETAETTTTEKAIPLNRLVARSTDEKAIPLTRLRSVGEFINAEPPRSLGEEFSVGLDRGEDQLRGLGYGLVGLAADALGVKGASDWGYENYRRAMEEAASKEASVTDPFEEIGSFSDFGRYTVGILGEQIPQLLASVAGGGVGGFVGKSLAKKMVANEVLKRVAAGATATAAEREIAEEATKSILRKAAMAKAAEEGGEAGLGQALGATLGASQPGAAGFTTIASSVPVSAGAVAGQAARGVLDQGFRYGAYTGAYLANFGQIAGGTYGQIRDETGEGGPEAVMAAVGTSIPGAALDTLSEIFIASRPIRSLRPFRDGVESKALGMSLPARVGLGAAKGVGLGSPLEGGTEYLQTGLEQAAVGIADPGQTVGQRLTAPGAERERRIAAAAGATVGGILGGGGGTLEFLAPRTKAKLDEIGATTLEERLRAAWPTASEDQKLQILQKLREKADELQGFQGATSDGPRLIAGNWTDEVDVDGLKLRYNPDANVWAAMNPPEIEGLGPAVPTELSNARVALIDRATRKGAALAARAQDALSALRGEVEPGQAPPPAEKEITEDDGTELVPVETMMARPPGRQGMGGARTPSITEAAQPGATIEFNGRRGIVTSSRTNLPGKDSTLPGRSIFLTADFGDGPADIPIGQVQNVRVISEQQLAREAETEAEIERLQNELDNENITEEDRRIRTEIISNLRARLLSPTASGIAFQDGPAGFTVGATESIAEFKRRRADMAAEQRAREKAAREALDGTAVSGMRTGDKVSVLLGDEMVPAQFIARNANGNARFRLDEDGSRIELTPEQFKNVGFRIENPAELTDEADFNRQLREAKSPEDLARLTGGFLPAGGSHKVKVKTPGGDSDLTYRVRYMFQTSRAAKPRLTGEAEPEAETIPGYFAAQAKELGGPTTEEGQEAVGSELARGLAEGAAAAEGTAVGFVAKANPRKAPTDETKGRVGNLPFQFIGGDSDTFNEIWGRGAQGQLVMKRPLFAKFELLVEPTPAKPDFEEAYNRAFQEEQAKVLAGDFYTGPQGEAVPVQKSQRQIQQEMDLARERATQRAQKEVDGQQANFNTSLTRLKKDILRSMDSGHVVTITPETVQEMEGRVGADELVRILKADPDVNIDMRVPLDPTGKPMGRAVPTVVSMVWRGLDGRQAPYTFTQGSKPVRGGLAQDPNDFEGVASGSPMTPQERDRERKLQAKEREAVENLAARQENERRELRNAIWQAVGERNRLREGAEIVAAERERRQALEQEINELRGALAATEAPAPASRTEAIVARQKELNEENDKAARSDMRLRKQLRETEEEMAKKRAASGKDTNSVAYRSRMSGDLSRLMDQRTALEGRLRESKNARNRRNAEIRRLNEQAKAVTAQEKQEAASRKAAAQRERRRLRAALAEREKALANFVVDEKPVQELQKAQEKVRQLESRREPLEAKLARERVEFQRNLKAYNPAVFDRLRGAGSFAKVYQTDPKRIADSETQRLDDQIEEVEGLVQMREELKNLPESKRILIEEILGKAATVFPGETNKNRLLAEAQRGSQLDVNETQQIIDVAQTLAYNSAVANFLRIIQERQQQGGAPSQIEEAEQARLTQAFISALNAVVRGRETTNPREVAASVLRLARQGRRSPSEERIAAQIEAATLGVDSDDIQEIFDADTEQALNKLEELRRKPTRDVTTKGGQRGQVDPKQLRGLWDRLYQIIEAKTASLTSDTPGSRARARAARAAGMVKKQDLAAAKKRVLESEKQGTTADTAVQELTAQLRQLPKPESISDTDPQVDQKRADLRQRRIDLNNALIAARNSAERQRARRDDKNRAERVGRLLDEVVAVMEEFYKTYNPLNAATKAVDAARKRAETARPNQVITQAYGTDPNIFGPREGEPTQMTQAEAQDLQAQMDAVKTDPAAKLMGSGSGTTPRMVLAREAMDYLRNQIPPEEAAIVYKVAGLAYSKEKRRIWYGDETGARLKQFEEALADLNELDDISEADQAVAEKHFAYIRDIPNLPPRQEPTDETETIQLRTTPTREAGVFDRGTAPGLRGSGQPERAANNRLRFAVAPSPVSGTGLDPSSYGDSELPRADAVSDSLGGQLGFDAPGGLPSAGQPDAGRPGGVPQPADGSTAGSRVQRNLSAAEIRRLAPQAERFYVEAFTEKDLSALPDEEIGRVYAAIQTEAKGAETTLAAGGNVIAQTPQPMADLLSSQSGLELLTGMAAEARQQQLNRERVANLRKNIGALAEARAFAGTTKFLETAANDTKLPAQLRLLAKELMRLNSRVEWDDNVATQIAAFGRNYTNNPITEKEIEKRVKVETKDKRSVFVYKIGGQRREVPVPARKADALEKQREIYEEVRKEIAIAKAVPWGGRAVNIRSEGAFSIYLNLNAVHNRPGGSVATLIHEYEHVVLGAKLDGEINLNSVETAALERLENMRRAAVTAAAKERGIAGEFDAVNAQLVEISGQEANQPLRALTNLQEFVIEATGNPEVFKLLAGLGFAQSDGTQAQFTGALRDLWNSVAELEAGVKMAPDSPLARAFVDSYMLTYASLGNPDKEYNVGFSGPTSQFTAPQIIKNALVDELDAALLQERFIRDQLKARNLAGTSADRNALAREFSALRAEAAKREAAREAELARGRTPTRAPRANLPDFKPAATPTVTTETKVETPPETTRSVLEILTGRKADDGPTQTDEEADAEQTERDDALARMSLALPEQEFVAAFNAARQNGVELPDVDPVTFYYVTRANAARQLGLTQRTRGPMNEALDLTPEEQANLAISENVEREISDLIAQLPDPNEPVFGQPTAERRAADARRAELGEALRAVQIQGAQRRQPRRDFLFTVQEYEELIAQNEARGNTEVVAQLRAELAERKKNEAAIAAAEKAAAKRAETARKKAERERAKAQAKTDDERGAKTAQRFGLTPKPKAEPKTETPPKAAKKAAPVANKTEAEIEADFNAAVASLEWGPWVQRRTGDGPKWVREAQTTTENKALWKDWKDGNKENFLARGLRTDKPKGAKVWNVQQWSTPSGVPDTEADIPPDQRADFVLAPVDDDPDYLEEADPTAMLSLGGSLDFPSEGRPVDTASEKFKQWFKQSAVTNRLAGGRDNQPLRVYHGSPFDLQAVFKSEADLQREKGVSRWGDRFDQEDFGNEGIYFTTDPNYSRLYSRQNTGANTTPVYLSIQNPYFVNERDTWWESVSRFFKAVRAVAGGEASWDKFEAEDANRFFTRRIESINNPLSTIRSSGYVGPQELKRLREEGYDGIINLAPNGNRNAPEIIVFSPTQIKSAITNTGDFSSSNPNIKESLGGTIRRIFRDEVVPTGTGTFVRPKLISALEPVMDRRGVKLDQQRRFAVNADVNRADNLLRVLARQMRQLAKAGTPLNPQTVTTAIGSLENPLTPAQREDIRTTALTDPEAATLLEARYRRENKEAFREKQKQARAALPWEVRAVAVEMSDHVESLSSRLKEMGLLSDELAMEIEENLGIYLNRSYAIFDNPKWAESVRQNAKIMADARRVIRQDLVNDLAETMRDQAAEDGRYLSREDAKIMANRSVGNQQVETELERYLALGKSPTKEILSGRIPGQKDLSILKRRGTLAPEIQALLGVYDDPETSYGKTVLKVSSLIHNHVFLDKLKRLGLGEGWFSQPPAMTKEGEEYVVRGENGAELFRSDDQEKAQQFRDTLDYQPPPGFVKIAATGNDKLAPLDGVYGNADIVEGLYQMFPAVEQDKLPWFLRMAGGATGWTMAFATVGSAQAQVRNYGSGWIKYLSTGNLVGGSWKSIRESHRLAWQEMMKNFDPDDPAGRAKLREEIEDIVRRGVFGESVTVNMINDLVEDYRKLGTAARKSETEFGKKFDEIIRRPVKQVWDFAQGTYSMGDNIHRGMVYFQEIENYRKAFPDWSEEKLKDNAAEIAREIYWTYSEAPRWVQDLKRGPGLVIAPFITFTTEVVRTMINTGLLAHREWQLGKETGNAELVKLAWRRVGGMAAAAVLPGIVGSAFMSMAGFSSDDEEDLRKFLPDWQRNNQLLLLGRTGSKISFADMSFLDPHEYFKKPVKGFLRAISGAQDPKEAIIGSTMEVAREMLDPFMSEQLFAGAVMDVARNVDATGRRIYNPQDSTTNIIASVGRHIGNVFVPGTFRSADRIARGVTGTVTETGRSYDPATELKAVLLGIRMNEIDLSQSLGFKASEYQRNKRDATALFNRVALNSGAIDPKAVGSAYERANMAHLRLATQIRQAYKAARRLGLSDSAAMEKLRAMGVSREDLERVKTGIYEPWQPSTEAQRELLSRGETQRLRELEAAIRQAQTEQLD